MEYLKILWIIVIALSGGLAGLFLNFRGNVKEVVLFIGGLILLGIVLATIFKLTVEVEKMTREEV